MSVEVKICGMTNVDDAKAALDMGVDYIGFVLYAKSPRAVTAAQVCGIIKALGTGAKAVGVFVNERRDKILEIAAKCGLFAVQLHGDEQASDYAGLSFPVWRAVKHAKGDWIPDPSTWKASRYLVDASVSGIYGGSGIKADWQTAAQLAKSVPVILAGGLNHDNVAGAIQAVKPKGVDVVTGVESEPGKKDREKMRRFIEAARNA